MDADKQEEFERSFGGSYFGFKHNGKVFPAKLAVDRAKPAAGSMPMTYYLDQEGKSLSYDLRWLTEREKLIRGYPTLGNIKVQNTFAYLSVRPSRQYRKGFAPENVTMVIPNLKDIQSKLPKFFVPKNSPKVAWRVFNEEYWHPALAAALMDQGEELGYPLSKNFATYISAAWETPLISYKGQDVGNYERGDWRLFQNFVHLKEQFQRETGVVANAIR